MSAERTHTELRFTRDPRLLAGVRAAVEFIAARSGMSDSERTDLAAASEDAACGAMKGLSEKQSLCAITIEAFGDRIEIRIERPARSEIRGTQSASEAASPAEELRGGNGSDALRWVDRVYYDSQNRKSTTTLVKFFSKKPAAR